MNRLQVVFAILAIQAAVISACDPPNCDKPDCGTCSNACCKVAFEYPSLSMTDAVAAIMKAGGNGGPDGLYAFATTNDGDFGISDYRKYNISISFMGQIYHQTKINRYRDTIDFVVIPRKNGGTRVEAFSISEIGGAWCDAGQNYKNVYLLFSSLGPKFTSSIMFGCGVDPNAQA